jgi:hypothetical protein
VSLAPRYGPEDPHVVGSMRLREAQYFGPFEFEQVCDTHSALPKKSLLLGGYRFAHGLTSGTRQVLDLVFGGEGETRGTSGTGETRNWFVSLFGPETQPDKPNKPDEPERRESREAIPPAGRGAGR